jgi:hypothetical protein
MLKKDITFEDFDGNTQTETHYFNLSKSELIDLEVGGENGSLGEQLKAIVASDDTRLILESFKTIVLRAYGIRSDDKKKFVKSDELRKDFEQSLAYDALFTGLVTNSIDAAEFVNGIVPKDLIEQVQTKNVELPDTPAEELPWANREPTAKELQGMSQAQLVQVYQRKAST